MSKRSKKKTGSSRSGGLTFDELVDKVRMVRTYSKGGIRAPHKPLLLLVALARIQKKRPRYLEYSNIKEELEDLLRMFGPSQKNYRPHFPFWRLRKDGFWEQPNTEHLEGHSASWDPPAHEMKVMKGGFTDDAYDLLEAEPENVSTLAQFILDEHFPETIHDEILDQIGLKIGPVKQIKSEKRVRSPRFRLKVLEAYDNRCAVCGFDLRLDGHPKILEAAHVRWFCKNGPNNLNNGLCLCSLHHKALDLGIIGISPVYELMVSSRVSGGRPVSRLLGIHRGQEIRKPQDSALHVAMDHRDWHFDNVFKKPQRGVRVQAVT